MGPVPEPSAPRAGLPGEETPPHLQPGPWWRQPPFWREGRWAREYVQLRRHPLFAGRDVPDGRGRPVLLVPGFLAGDASLAVMQNWLERTGYHAELSGIAFNVRYSEVVVRRLTMRLVDVYAWLGRRVILIGHSRGGLLAKVLSHRHPEMVERVVTLGSPLRDPYDVHPLTLAGVRLAHAFNFVRYGRTGAIERRFLRDLEAPVRVPTTSVYSKTDGIVRWEACVRPDLDNREVRGSHVGLGVNLEVYEHLVRLLPAAGRRPAPPR